MPVYSHVLTAPGTLAWLTCLHIRAWHGPQARARWSYLPEGVRPPYLSHRYPFSVEQVHLTLRDKARSVFLEPFCASLEFSVQLRSLDCTVDRLSASLPVRVVVA